MLTLQQIKENPQGVIERLAVKGFDGNDAINNVIALDAMRREQQLKNDNIAAELKKLAASIGALMKQGQKEQAETAKATVAALKEQKQELADKLSEAEKGIRDILHSGANQQ